MTVFRVLLAFLLAAGVLSPPNGRPAVYNLKVVTDASPDYSDMESMVRSITANWPTPEEKCWAMFYWNHIARRQTAPMVLHGMALTDPIRQFNDYGYAMCSTISGINGSIWKAMGFNSKYWDISNHTVSEVEYGGQWHMYDNSMTAVYTLCDGRTTACVTDIGKTGACAASNGRSEPGHIARYHCLMATSPRGFLTGADTIRSLDEEYRCFNPNGLKYRSYFHDWDRGHRYILNLRNDEAYTRYYRSLGKTPEYFVPNGGKDPEAANIRYRIRGNGVRVYEPSLKADEFLSSGRGKGIIAVEQGLAPEQARKPGEIVFKVEGANVITSMRIKGRLFRKGDGDSARIALSTVNGLKWKNVWQSTDTGEQLIDLNFVEEVNGAYEVLVKVSLTGHMKASDAQLRDMWFEIVTMLNSKTQPKLNLGKNTVYVGAGEQTESIVFWPDLQGENYKPYVLEERNIASAVKHPGYMGVVHAVKPNEDAYVVFKIEAPRDITRVTYGGRLYNRAPRSRISFLHSFDAGKTWHAPYTLTNTSQPWDVIHYETVEQVPAATRSVVCKFLLNSSAAGVDACSLYAVRMEVNHTPVQTQVGPIEMTFNWNERQADYSLVERSHTELVTKLPHRYTINVGGADHPIVNWLAVKTAAGDSDPKRGYSDGKDVGGGKFVPRWVTYGKNLARGKSYTVTIPSTTQWDAGDPDGTKLTDGVVGPPYPGGTAPRYALCWNKGQNAEINLDLGAVKDCAAFRIQVGAGWPWWDALKGQVRDKVEVQSSTDGRDYQSHGFFNLNLRWKDLPANHFWPDEEVIAAHLYELPLPSPVQARHVRFKLVPERTLTASEVEVLDSIRSEPFDLRIKLPGS